MTGPGEVPLDDPPAAAPVIRSAGLTLAGSALGGLLVITSEFLVAHYLEVEAYGLYASGLTLARIGEAVAVFGLPVAIFHFVPLQLRRGEDDRAMGTVLAAALLPMVLGCTLALALWLAAPWLAARFFGHADATPYIRVLAAAIPFMASSEVLGAATRGFGYAKYYVLVRNLAPPVLFMAFIAAVIATRGDAHWIPAAFAAAYAIACIAGAFAVAHAAGSGRRRVKPRMDFAGVYRYSAGVMANTFLYMVFAVAGILLVAAFLGTDNVGIYRVCLQVVVPFDMVLLAFHAAMGPIYPVLAREYRQAELEDAYGMAIRWMAGLLLPAGIAVAWNARDLLALLGPDFVRGATPLTVLAAGYASCTCFGTVAYILMLSGRKHVETANAAFATAAVLLLGLWLVPRHGLLGAAAATAGAFVLLNVARIAEARRVLGLRTFRAAFVRMVAVASATALGSFWVLERLGVAQGPGAAALLGRLTLMGAVQAAATWGLAMAPQDRAALAGMVRSALGGGRRRGA